jgi:ubiquinone/menaquinone biosynthesis C-methylase UbiE
MPEKELFDGWPERYNQWFATPIGRLVRQTEGRLVLEMLEPRRGERILDAGCGTAIFTLDFLAAGAEVTGLDISRQMLLNAVKNAAGYPFAAVRGDMVHLPFRDNTFDKSVSVTALEFIEDGKTAIDELFRVTRPGGLVVVATLNSLSPWAERRRTKTQKGHRHILENAFYRPPSDLLALSPLKGTARTVVHFNRDDDPLEAEKTEQDGISRGLRTGAFVAARWVKK